MNTWATIKRNQCVSKECKYYRRFDFIKRMKIYDAKLFTCHRASSKLCQLLHTQNLLRSIDKKKLCALCQAESDWDWVTDTLRKQSTCAPCSELDQLEMTLRTSVFQIVENDLKFGAVILWHKYGGEPRGHSHSWKVLEVVGVIVFGWNKIVNHMHILFAYVDKRWQSQSSRSYNYAVTPSLWYLF